jgi:hypothetical protein
LACNLPTAEADIGRMPTRIFREVGGFDAETFFNLLKRERIRRKKYKAREEMRRNVFDYIEFFYNRQRKHARNGMLPLITLEP